MCGARNAQPPRHSLAEYLSAYPNGLEAPVERSAGARPVANSGRYIRSGRQ